MLATRMAPKPPSPPAAAFEGDDACACRSSSEWWPRMTNIPLLRTVLTRSPSEGRVIRGEPRVPASQATRSASRLSTPCVRRPRCVRPTSATQTKQRRALTSRVFPASTTRLTPRACSRGLGPFDRLRARARSGASRGLGPLDATRPGNRAFHDAQRASADRARVRGALSAPVRATRSSL